MNKLMDAAVRLYHIRHDEQVKRFMDAIGTGESFDDTNFTDIWFWACNRWPDFPSREYKLRRK
jgi:hypothetical protein